MFSVTLIPVCYQDITISGHADKAVRNTDLPAKMLTGLEIAWDQGHFQEVPSGQRAGLSSEGQAEHDWTQLRGERGAVAVAELGVANDFHFVTVIDSEPESVWELRGGSDLEPRCDFERGSVAAHDLCWAVQVMMIQQQCLQLGQGGVGGSGGGVAAC